MSGSSAEAGPLAGEAEDKPLLAPADEAPAPLPPLAAAPQDVENGEREEKRQKVEGRPEEEEEEVREVPLLPGGHKPSGETMSSLTADNLSLHLAFLQRRNGAENEPLGQVKTLGMQDPSIMERRALYSGSSRERRSGRKKSGGLSPKKDKKAFLSNLPEVEADVDYRFNFIVVAGAGVADKVVELVCESEAAQALSSGRGEAPRSARASKPKANRCLCSVSSQPKKTNEAVQKKLAKLVFNCVNFGGNIPPCMSRLEALSTAIVFLVHVDEAEKLKDELASLAAAIERQRGLTRSKFRPVRAVVLCSKESPKSDDWALPLADFEDEQGDMWKFGPLVAGDGDALHAAFAEMAATRIAAGHGEGNNVPGWDRVLDGEMQEGEEEEEGVERALLEQQMEQRVNGVSGSAQRRAGSETPSDCSEGWQRPPVFEAEYEGSECSEETLEWHARTYGVDPAEVQEQLPCKEAAENAPPEKLPTPEKIERSCYAQWSTALGNAVSQLCAKH